MEPRQMALAISSIFGLPAGLWSTRVANTPAAMSASSAAANGQASDGLMGLLTAPRDLKLRAESCAAGQRARFLAAGPRAVRFARGRGDRKTTRLYSRHPSISYPV